MRLISLSVTGVNMMMAVTVTVTVTATVMVTFMVSLFKSV